MGDSISYKVRRSISEHHYYETGALLLGFPILQIFFHYEWKWVYPYIWVPIVFIYIFLDRFIPRKLVISESQIKIGRVKVFPSQLERINISPDDHRISMEFFLDDRDIRNIHRPRIRVQPIDREQVLYEELGTWANHHQIQVKGWHQV
jgi:hypothetical protein